ACLSWAIVRRIRDAATYRRSARAPIAIICIPRNLLTMQPGRATNRWQGEDRLERPSKDMIIRDLVNARPGDSVCLSAPGRPSLTYGGLAALIDDCVASLSSSGLDPSS